MWEARGRGWVASLGWWERLALVRSGYVGQGRETWTGGCWATDLWENERKWSLIVSGWDCQHAVCGACTNLVLEAGPELWAAGWRGQCAGSFLHSHHWLKRMLITQREFSLIAVNHIVRGILRTYVCAHWYSLRKAPPVGKAEEFLRSSQPERRWPHEGQHRGSGGGNLSCC